MTTTPRTILCIDDDAHFQAIVRSFLTSEGYKVLTAADGMAGLAVFREYQPEVVVLDLRMPVMDGFKVLAALSLESPETPVIVVSGEGEMVDVIRALRLGACNFITKPIETLDLLEHAVAEALTKSDLIKDNKVYQENLEGMVADRTAELFSAMTTLRLNEQKLATVIENFDGFVCLCDAECRITFANGPLLRHFGHEIIGKPCRVALFGTDAPCPTKNRPDGGNTVSGEFLHAVDNRWYQFLCTALADDGGAVVEYQIIFHDITEEKKARQDLEAREVVLRDENRLLKANLAERYRFGDIIGKSAAMQEVYELILKAASSEAGVIITGESGTGKELVARAIHKNSPRAENPLVCVNSGAIPKELIESEFFGHVKGAFTGATGNKRGFLDLADSGTLFLDEIGEISLSMQVKLLRVLDGHGYCPVGGDRELRPNVRIIAATNLDLIQMVKEGGMREDFFYRIQVIPIHLPPLRERREDIPLLIEHFLARLGTDKTPPISGRSLAALLEYPWPGNIRELQNTILRYVSLGTMDFMGIQVQPENTDGLFGDILSTGGAANYHELLAQVEKQIISKTLAHYGWHRGKAAQALALDPKTLRKKMRQFNLDGESS